MRTSICRNRSSLTSRSSKSEDSHDQQKFTGGILPAARTNQPAYSHRTSTTRLIGPLVLRSADDHHAFHEDAKPGDLGLQLPIRWRSSSKKFWTIWTCLSIDGSLLTITKRPSGPTSQLRD